MSTTNTDVPALDEFEYWLDAAGLAVQVPVAESGGEPFSTSGLPRGQAARGEKIPYERA